MLRIGGGIITIRYASEMYLLIIDTSYLIVHFSLLNMTAILMSRFVLISSWLNTYTSISIRDMTEYFIILSEIHLLRRKMKYSHIKMVVGSLLQRLIGDFTNLPDHHSLRFGVEQSLEQIIGNPSSTKTMVTEFFVKNASDGDARRLNLLYREFP